MFTPKVDKLRKKYPSFIYEDYLIEKKNNDLVLKFRFSVPPDLFFEPVVVFKDVLGDRLEDINGDVLNNLVFHIGLAEIASYWKATCSGQIIIKAGHLSQDQLNWWHGQILGGMGEYFFENQIDFTDPDFLILKNDFAGENSKNVFEGLLGSKVMVPVGGGKDSLVTLGAIKNSDYKINTFVLNNNRVVEVALRSSKAAGFNNPITVERFLDKSLTGLEKAEFLNGHVPFSLYLAFVTVLSAVLGNYKYIAVSNESSANEESVIYLGKKINHQYSKSFIFEQAFNSYAKEYLAGDVEYFSFLRPLYEIQIVKLFSKYKEFFNVFSSCNVSLAKDVSGWCSKCPKCLFVFVMIYPFISLEDIKTIFGFNLFEDSTFVEELRSLAGLEDQKPFECVGTKDEVKIGLYLSLEKNKKLNINQPILLEYFENQILPKEPNIKDRAEALLISWNDNNLLPKEFEAILKKEVHSV